MQRGLREHGSGECGLGSANISYIHLSIFLAMVNDTNVFLRTLRRDLAAAERRAQELQDEVRSYKQGYGIGGMSVCGDSDYGASAISSFSPGGLTMEKMEEKLKSAKVSVK